MTIRKIRVKLERRYAGNSGCETLELEWGTSLEDVLPKTDLSSIEDYMIVVGGRLRKGDYVLQDGDRVQVFASLDGG